MDQGMYKYCSLILPIESDTKQEKSDPGSHGDHQGGALKNSLGEPLVTLAIEILPPVCMGKQALLVRVLTQFWSWYPSLFLFDRSIIVQSIHTLTLARSVAQGWATYFDSANVISPDLKSLTVANP